MNRAMLQEILVQWSQCSDFIKTALLKRFQAIQAMSGRKDWLGYLADEFGLLREGR
jgi:hypothetical protein